MERCAWLLLAFGIASSCAPAEREVLANYEDGARQSRGTEVRRDGEWLRHGSFNAWHENGVERAGGAFVSGEQDGEWSQWHANSQLGSRGSWDRGEKIGPWTYWHENGEKLGAGEYVAGRRSGPWVFHHDNGVTRARGAFLADLKEGVWLHRDPDGTLDRELTGVYEAGERFAEWRAEGLYTDWYEDGGARRETSEWRDGLLHGHAITWYRNGRKQSEGDYADGLRTGPWRFWREDGGVDAKRTGFYQEHVLGRG